MRTTYEEYKKLKRLYKSQLIIPQEKSAIIVLHKYPKTKPKDDELKQVVNGYQRQGLLKSGYYVSSNKNICVISDYESCEKIFETLPSVRYIN